jgi:hypothetical protein
MKNIFFCMTFLLLSCCTAFSQQKDSIDFVKHFGVIFPVQNKSTLSNPEFKKLIKGNKLALASLRKARLVRTAELSADILAVIPLVIGLGSENDVIVLGGIGGYAAITTLSTLISRPHYNRHLENAIKLYNMGPAPQRSN